jgi:hypothetical protein
MVTISFTDEDLETLRMMVEASEESCLRLLDEGEPIVELMRMFLLTRQEHRKMLDLLEGGPE